MRPGKVVVKYVVGQNEVQVLILFDLNVDS